MGTPLSAAEKLYREGIEYFDRLENISLRKTRDDLQAIKKFQEGQKITERLISIIFKNTNLVKSLKKHAKTGALSRAGIVCDSVKKEDEDEGVSSSGELLPVSNVVWNTSGPDELYRVREYIWDKAALEDLVRRVTKHTEYLSHMRTRKWSQLNSEEKEKIVDFVKKAEQWCEHIESNVDRKRYIKESEEILCAIESLESQFQEVSSVPTGILTRRIGYVSDPVHAKNQEKAQPSQGNFMQQVLDQGTRTAPLIKKLQFLNEKFMGMYGKIKKTGNVIEHMQVTNLPPFLFSELEPIGQNVDVCPKCGVEYVHDVASATSACRTCGNSVNYQCANNVNFDEVPTPLIKTKNYNPKMYFRLWLDRVQAKAKADIPDDVFQAVINECIRRKIKTVNDRIVRNILKMKNLACYYSAIPSITTKLTGVPAPQFASHEIKIFGQMWDLVWGIYSQWEVDGPERKGRKSFLSYPYFCYQCCRIRKWEQYYRFFHLLEGRKNRIDHDRMWKILCQQLNWDFFPTI